jgi:hypothetical protein
MRAQATATDHQLGLPRDRLAVRIQDHGLSRQLGRRPLDIWGQVHHMLLGGRVGRIRGGAR